MGREERGMKGASFRCIHRGTDGAKGAVKFGVLMTIAFFAVIVFIAGVYISSKVQWCTNKKTIPRVP